MIEIIQTILLLGILICNIRGLVRVPATRLTSTGNSSKTDQTPCYTILKGSTVIGIRPEGHPDIREALDTPGLAIIRPNGTKDLGIQ
jgi:hypothetical protein